MSTEVSLTSTAFVQVSTATDFIVQNVGRTPVLYSFAGTLPAVGDPAGVLQLGQALQKTGGAPSGNLYARMARDGNTGSLIVSE